MGKMIFSEAAKLQDEKERSEKTMLSRTVLSVEAEQALLSYANADIPFPPNALTQLLEARKKYAQDYFKYGRGPLEENRQQRLQLIDNVNYLICKYLYL